MLCRAAYRAGLSGAKRCRQQAGLGIQKRLILCQKGFPDSLRRQGQLLIFLLCLRPLCFRLVQLLYGICQRRDLPELFFQFCILTVIFLQLFPGIRKLFQLFPAGCCCFFCLLNLRRLCGLFLLHFVQLRLQLLHRLRFFCQCRILGQLLFQMCQLFRHPGSPGCGCPRCIQAFFLRRFRFCQTAAFCTGSAELCLHLRQHLCLRQLCRQLLLPFLCGFQCGTTVGERCLIRRKRRFQQSLYF